MVAYLPHKWNQMMLAHAKYLDVADQNHLTVVYIKDGVLGEIPCAFVVAFGKKEHSPGVPFGSFEKTLSVWIFSNIFEDVSYIGGQLFLPVRNPGGEVSFPMLTFGTPDGMVLTYLHCQGCSCLKRRYRHPQRWQFPPRLAYRGIELSWAPDENQQ
jgi:hypothetical protein